MRKPTSPRLIIRRPLCPANPSSLLGLPMRHLINMRSFTNEAFGETEGLEDFDCTVRERRGSVGAEQRGESDGQGRTGIALRRLGR